MTTVENTVGIIDFGMGNLASIEAALGVLGVNVKVLSNPQETIGISRYILPGVGSFAEGISNLRKRGFDDLLQYEVIKCKKPILGICLGMQLLADNSSEDGYSDGLGWIPGAVRRIKPGSSEVKIPHVGWNDISFLDNTLYLGVEQGTNFYFDHSFEFVGGRKFVSATVKLDKSIVASIQFKNIFGTQFHPEKSQNNGLRVLRNFCNIDQY